MWCSEHVVCMRHCAFSLSFYCLLIEPYEVSFHIKKCKLREERWHSLWFRGYWISEIRLLSLPSVLYRLSYSWHMWHSSPIWWRYFLLPYKNVSFVSPFKQQDMVSRSSLCSSWLLLCYYVFSRNDCVWSNVCLYVLLYIYIWMGGGWLDGWIQHLVIFFSYNKQFEIWHPYLKQLSLI